MEIFFSPLASILRATEHEGMRDVTNVGGTTSFRVSCFTRVYPTSIYRLLFIPTSAPLVRSPSPALFILDFFSGFTRPLLLFLPRMKNKWCCTAWRPDVDVNAVVFHETPRRSVLRFRLTRRYIFDIHNSPYPIYYACHARHIVCTIACHFVISVYSRKCKTLNIYLSQMWKLTCVIHVNV